MECGRRHGHRHHNHPGTEDECLHAFSKLNNSSTRCPVEWDPIAERCWPPVLAGTRASIPCPTRHYLNPLHNACRQCLTNGTWYVDPEQDPTEPYTNYNDCFLWEEEEFRIKIERIIGKDTMLIHDTLNDPGDIQFWLHGLSILLTGFGLLIWFSIWIHQRPQWSKLVKYKFMVTAYSVMLILHGLYTVYFGLNYNRTLITCYLFRIVHTFVEASLYTVIFFYCLETTAYVSGKSFSSCIRRTIYFLGIMAIVIITGLEGWIEIWRPPHRFCAFGVYLNSLHWIILWAKVAINGGSFVLICVSLFGLCYLNMPQTTKTKWTFIIKQNMFILSVWVIFCFILQFCPMFIYHMKEIGYSFQDIVQGTRVYSHLMASSGIVFVCVTCILDIQILAFLVPSLKNYLNNDEDTPILRVRVIRSDSRSKCFEW